jgi:hypothetical protein
VRGEHGEKLEGNALTTVGAAKARAKNGNHDGHDGHDENQESPVIPAKAGIQERTFRREAPQTKYLT